MTNIEYILFKEQELLDCIRTAKKSWDYVAHGDDTWIKRFREQFNELEKQYEIEMAKL